MRKKYLSIAICLILVLSLFAGCANKNANVLQVKTITNDTLKLTINDACTYKFDNNVYTLINGENELVQFSFYQKKEFDRYMNELEIYLHNDSDINSIVLKGYHNGLKYVVIEYDAGSGRYTYELIGCVVGSNTGIISKYIDSIEDAKMVINTIVFEIIETKQTEDKYYFESINELSTEDVLND